MKKLSNDDGGPVFPKAQTERTVHRYNREPVTYIASGSDGMTLADWLAGQAMAGLLAYPGDDKSGSWHTNASVDATARHAYEIADAMIAEKRRRESGEET